MIDYHRNLLPLPDVLTLERLEQSVRGHEVDAESDAYRKMAPLLWRLYRRIYDTGRPRAERALMEAALDAEAGKRPAVLDQLCPDWDWGWVNDTELAAQDDRWWMAGNALLKALSAVVVVLEAWQALAARQPQPRLKRQHYLDVVANRLEQYEAEALRHDNNAAPS